MIAFFSLIVFRGGGSAAVTTPLLTPARIPAGVFFTAGAAGLVTIALAAAWVIRRTDAVSVGLTSPALSPETE